MPEKTAIVLMDQPEDNYCETLGWVDVTLTEDEARDALEHLCFTEDGEAGYRPTGPAERVWLKPDPEVPDMWTTATRDESDAVEFWQVVVA